MHVPRVKDYYNVGTPRITFAWIPQVVKVQKVTIYLQSAPCKLTLYSNWSSTRTECCYFTSVVYINCGPLYSLKPSCASQKTSKLNNSARPIHHVTFV